MGMFNFFKNRKAQESAVPSTNVENLQAIEANVPKGQAANAPVGEMPSSPAMGGMQWSGGQMDVGDVFGMVSQAIKSGHAQVNVGTPQVIDMRGTGLREEMFEVMKQHGVDPTGAHVAPTDPQAYAGMQQQMMDVLAKHGLDVSAMQEQAAKFAQGQGIPQVSPPTTGTEPPQS